MHILMLESQVGVVLSCKRYTHDQPEQCVFVSIRLVNSPVFPGLKLLSLVF